MDRAIHKLDEHLQTKTVHSTKSLELYMANELCQDDSLFSNREAQEEFQQKCHNFGVFSRSINKTGWGRKQFEDWWNDGSFWSDKEAMAWQEDRDSEGHLKMGATPGVYSEVKEDGLFQPPAFPRHAMNVEPCEGGYKLTTPWGDEPGVHAFVPLDKVQEVLAPWKEPRFEPGNPPSEGFATVEMANVYIKSMDAYIEQLEDERDRLRKTVVKLRDIASDELLR